SVTCGQLCGRGAQVPAGAVAADRDSVRVATKLGCVRDCPPERGQSVAYSCREWMLGRQAVVNGQDMDLRVAAQHAAGLVMRIQIAGHPPATVEEHEQRRLLRRARRGWAVVPGAQCAVGALDLEVANVADLRLDEREHARLLL